MSPKSLNCKHCFNAIIFIIASLSSYPTLFLLELINKFILVNFIGHKITLGELNEIINFIFRHIKIKQIE
ncbi:hypothetical protein BpHYR1_016469 [Brachionus plicatilis]|uniref:Uncharacterized protein n=1 Tax=Brachionus plicatilis TaxID=10195 RepID=A0A3M7PNG5_BRAPC|nr:hypothetical protein BpHYR1_016469 [Brachionus plicatilis]